MHTPYIFPLPRGSRAPWGEVGRVKYASYSGPFTVFDLVSEGKCELMTVFTAPCVLVSLDAILTSWRKRMDGQWWQCRKARKEVRYT